MDPSLALFSKRHAHHGARAGYNLLTQQLPEAHLLWAPEGRLARLEGGLSRRLLAPLSGSTWFGLGGLRGLLQAARWLRGRAHPVLHVLYGEDLLGFLPLVRRACPGVKILATFHQPPERFARLIKRPEHLSGLDAAIALDASNAAALESHFPGRVHTLWLGVDTDYWRPAAEPYAGPPTVLAVGNHLRDFSLLRALILRLTPQGVHFELVLPAARLAEFSALPNTRARAGISDEALRAAYQQASLHLLPLKGGSANNALLQAMACGLPTVASALPGVRAYLGEAGAYFPVGALDDAADQITKLLAAPAALTRAAARAQAEARSWPALAEAHRALYRQLHRPA